jgi:hypothetical protein
MKTHHVWWPHMDREPLFNPFVPVTQQRHPEPEPIDLGEEEHEQPNEETPSAEAPGDEK